MEACKVKLTAEKLQIDDRLKKKIEKMKVDFDWNSDGGRKEDSP